MADASNIVVSVESVIHDELRRVFQKISDEYGVQILDVSADWMDVTGFAYKKKDSQVRDMKFTTETGGYSPMYKP